MSFSKAKLIRFNDVVDVDDDNYSSENSEDPYATDGSEDEYIPPSPYQSSSGESVAPLITAGDFQPDSDSDVHIRKSPVKNLISQIIVPKPYKTALEIISNYGQANWEHAIGFEAQPYEFDSSFKVSSFKKSPANYTKSTEKTNKAAIFSPATSENGSVKSVPANFKTPTLPKKTKSACSAAKLKPKELFSIDFEALKEKNEECENKTKFIHKLSEELEVCEKKLKNLLADKERLEREHQNELQNLEFEMLQTMTRLQNQEENAQIKLKELEEKLQKEMEKIKKTSEYQMGQVVLDYEIKIKDYKEANEEALENKLREIEKVWLAKLENKEKEHEAILKECQDISEYSIIECELEKKQIQSSLEEANNLYAKLEKKYNQKLSQEISTSCEKELNDKIAILHGLLEKSNEEVRKLKAQIKAYEMTISNSQMAIEVMTKRLIESDRGVEQLKLELTNCEEKLLDYESKYYRVTEELQDARNLNDDMEIHYETALESSVESIKFINQTLLDKVDQYKEQVIAYSKQIKHQEELKTELMDQLSESNKLIDQVGLGLVKTEKYYSIRMKGLEEDLQKSETLNEEKNEKLKEFEEKIENLTNTNKDLTDKYLYYKSKAEELETDTKDCTQTRKKYIEISGKYDALWQDFEHLDIESRDDKIKISGMQLKLQKLLKIEEGYEKLKKEKESLENENLKMKIALEEQKLKKKFKLGSKNKENVASPNRSLLESPSSRGSPFRERNNN